jgi:energy-coupling factor transporter ATP-binding protein EcfA2
MGKLNFRSVRIRKAPGFPVGLAASGLLELSAEINLITGPNGAGKSTTARMIRKLIWTKKTKGLSLRGDYELDGNSWVVDIDSEYHKIQKDGINTVPSGIPAVESQGNYFLALHELVNVADGDLAKRIAAESIGGYNLESAEIALKFSDAIRSTTSTESREYKKAKDELFEIINVHKGLKAQEEELLQLGIEREKAEKAGSLKLFFGVVIDFLTAKQTLNQALVKLSSYPEALKKASGDEPGRITEIEAEIAAENEEILRADQAITGSRRIIEKLPLPEKGIDEGVLSGLNDRISRLAEFERNIHENTPKIADLESRELIARKSIDNLADVSQWKGLNMEQAGDLDQYFQNAQGVILRKISLENEIKRLGESSDQKPVNQDPLRNGIGILSQWLKEQEGSSGIPSSWLLWTGILIVIGVVAVFIEGKWGSLGFILALAFLVWVFFNKNKGKTVQNITVRQTDYAMTGLTPPRNWDSASVTEKINELIQELSQTTILAEEEKSKTDKRKDLQEKLENLKDEISKINIVRDLYLEKFKAVPGLPEKIGDNQSKLYWFLKHVSDWQAASSALTALQAEQKALWEQHSEELRTCNKFFAELQSEPASDSISARAEYVKLSGYENNRKKEAGNIEKQMEFRLQNQSRIDLSLAKLKGIYDRLSIENGNKDELIRIMRDFDDFTAARQEFHTAETNFKIKESELLENAIYPEQRELIENISLFDAWQKQIEFETLAAGLIDIVEKIKETDTLVKQKKEGGELEAGLANKQNALLDLQNLYEQNLGSLTGSIIVKRLKETNGEQNQPEVLKKADRLFNTITSGRYNLKVSNVEGASFTAFDNVSRIGQSLDELSTGTRVQLLLSVRLAFIESLETGTRLPILADELLANSDDSRANAIIEALYRISKEGRQIFYFTAQPDEVMKWSAFLKTKNDIDFKIIYLNDNHAEEGNYPPDKPAFNRLEFVREIPEPSQSNPIEYREKLKIATYDPMTYQPARLSVAWLTDDTKLIFNCLRSGISQWGQLLSFYNLNGNLPGLTDEAVSKMRIRVKLLEEFQNLYRQGRSRPVDWEVLEKADVVTTAFVEQVQIKLLESKGDPEVLLDLISRIPRFQKANVSLLREFFLSNNYLPSETALSMEDLKVSLMARISNLDISPEEAEDFINGVFGNNYQS